MALRLKAGTLKVPKTTNLVCNAIDAMDGASLSQITNYFAKDKGISVVNAVRDVKLAVKRGLDSGVIKMKNGIYNLHKARDAEDLMVSHRRRRKSNAGKSPKRRRKSHKRSVRRGKRHGVIKMKNGISSDADDLMVAHRRRRKSNAGKSPKRRRKSHKRSARRGKSHGVIKMKNGISSDADDLMVAHRRRRKSNAGKSPKRRRKSHKRSVRRGKSHGRRRSVKRRAVKNVRRRNSVKLSVKRLVGGRRRQAASSDDEESVSGSPPPRDAGSDVEE